MKVFFENCIEGKLCFDFDYEALAYRLCEYVLTYLSCPFDCEISILLTDNTNIRNINNDTRQIDKETDVLSFPNLFYEKPAVFDITQSADCINPENELVVLGDIILSYDMIISQADEYNHSIMREYAFLITHSMLHLCGFDHINEDDAAIMEEHQRIILNDLKITR